MKVRNLSYILLALPFMIGCKKNSYNFYEGIGIAQFGPTINYLYQSYYDMTDTLKTYSFAYQASNTTQDTVYFDLYALGGITNYDRPFKLKQVSVFGKENAVPGVHYKAFDDPSVTQAYVVKAGEMHMRVPIVLIRDASLKSKNVALQMEVDANEHFRRGEANKIWRRVEFADMLIRPNAWSDNHATQFWGKYSQVKHQFMIDQTGEPWDEEFMTAFVYDLVFAVHWKGKLRGLLAEYNAARPGNPLRDEDGELVVFP